MHVKITDPPASVNGQSFSPRSNCFFPVHNNVFDFAVCSYHIYNPLAKISIDWGFIAMFSKNKVQEFTSSHPLSSFFITLLQWYNGAEVLHGIQDHQHYRFSHVF